MSNEKKILIHIKSCQTDSEGNTDGMEFYAEGKLYVKGSSIYIVYSESEITGMEGTTSTVKLAEDSVTLMRFGSVNSKMIFQKGIITHNKYNTAYGVFDIDIHTTKLYIDVVQGKKSTIKLAYKLYFDKSEPQLNELTLDFMY